MKNQFIRIGALLAVIALITFSCEKENEFESDQDAVLEVDQDKSIHWETIDPKVIEAYEAERAEEKKNPDLSKANLNQTYRGIKILISKKTPKDIIRLVKGEIDETYRSSLRQSLKKKLPQALVDIRRNVKGQIFYAGREKAIVIWDWKLYKKIIPGPGNVYFHEAIHHFDAHNLSGNVKKQVKSNFTNAKNNKIYPAREYVLSNRFEYLATSTETYFFGRDFDLPRTKANLKKKDPSMFNLIKNNID